LRAVELAAGLGSGIECCGALPVSFEGSIERFSLGDWWRRDAPPFSGEDATSGEGDRKGSLLLALRRGRSAGLAVLACLPVGCPRLTASHALVLNANLRSTGTVARVPRGARARRGRPRAIGSRPSTGADRVSRRRARVARDGACGTAGAIGHTSTRSQATHVAVQDGLGATCRAGRRDSRHLAEVPAADTGAMNRVAQRWRRFARGVGGVGLREAFVRRRLSISPRVRSGIPRIRLGARSRQRAASASGKLSNRKGAEDGRKASSAHTIKIWRRVAVVSRAYPLRKIGNLRPWLEPPRGRRA
jgi:hypothetical protein